MSTNENDTKVEKYVLEEILKAKVGTNFEDLQFGTPHSKGSLRTTIKSLMNSGLILLEGELYMPGSSSPAPTTTIDQVPEEAEEGSTQVVVVENNLVALNDMLFDQMKRLGNTNLKGEALLEECVRARCISLTTNDIISNGRLILDSAKARKNLEIELGPIGIEG